MLHKKEKKDKISVIRSPFYFILSLYKEKLFGKLRSEIRLGQTLDPTVLHLRSQQDSSPF